MDDAAVKALVAATTKNGTLRALLYVALDIGWLVPSYLAVAPTSHALMRCVASRRLPRNDITDKGAGMLAELLKGSSLLTSLDVSGTSTVAPLPCGTPTRMTASLGQH